MAPKFNVTSGPVFVVACISRSRYPGGQGLGEQSDGANLNCRHFMTNFKADSLRLASDYPVLASGPGRLDFICIVFWM